MLRFIKYLSTYLTDAKRERIERILSGRTRYLTVVLEDIYDPMNASAVLRSAEAFGVQDVHVIENRHSFTVNKKVSGNIEKWITLHRYNKNFLPIDPKEFKNKKNRSYENTKSCFMHLRQNGYQILATTPHEPSIEISTVALNKPTALLMGSEHFGLSDYALKNADHRVKIPMLGFVESFNISVSGAVCLYQLRQMLHNSEINWQLTETEKNELNLAWMRRIIHRADLIEVEYRKQNT